MTKHTSGTALLTLEDRYAIADAIHRWCRAVDRRDWDAIDDCFHPGAQDNHGIYQGDIPGLKDWLIERHQTITSSSHCATNILIDAVTDERAVVETYVVAYQRYPGDPAAAKTRSDITGGAAAGAGGTFDMMITGRYIDIFEKRDGAWRIRDRTTTFDSSQMFPVPDDGARLDPSWPIGKRDGSDPLYAVRQKALLA